MPESNSLAGEYPDPRRESGLVWLRVSLQAPWALGSVRRSERGPRVTNSRVVAALELLVVVATRRRLFGARL